ncbi:uncharacterized protein LOC131045736 [Cryptomeria japonica]|uniref:uncharacterized protein LOC131045736 n=1 Tax=Cryptomeria japonica TaxID=3369 RepID=UPI0025AC874B|nr:uncharacterized protein LOC131045736 [Cryptomeria japonica]
MGNFQARHSDPEFLSACRKFSPDELKNLKSLFVSLASQSRSHGQFIIASVLQAYYGIHGALGARMFDLVTRLRKDQMLTYEDLIIAKGIYEKGCRDEIENFMYQLVDLTGDGVVDRSELEAVIISALETVLGPKDAIVGFDLPEDSVQAFINSVKFTQGSEGDCNPHVSFEDFKRWCTQIPSIKKFLAGLLTPLGSGNQGCQVPQLVHSENINPSLLIMRKEYAWHIAGALQHQEAHEWVLLYHSSFNGLSFNTFMGNSAVGRGPSILLVKDKDGYIYGGFASQPWERHSDFYGDMKSFLFTLSPRAAIYRPTGANSNMQWCATSFTSTNIPNGLGFGGQVNHFGLFLSGAFDQGQSFKCVTYDSPCLSKNANFYPETIECWGVVVEGNEQETASVMKGTVLNRFKEDHNMLKMMGMANASE